MRKILIGLAFALTAMPASAQTMNENIANCRSKLSPDVQIAACTALLSDMHTPRVFWEPVHTARGLAYSKKGLEDRAIADYTAAISAAMPGVEVSSIYEMRGQSYYNKRMFAESIADYSKAIALGQHGDLADLYKLRASAYQMNHQIDKAIADYRKALQLEPGAQAVKDVLKSLGATP